MYRVRALIISLMTTRTSRCSSTGFFTSVEFVDLFELFVLSQRPVIVYVVILLGRNVNWWVLIVKLLLSLFAIELGQYRWLLVGFLFFVFRSSLLAIVLFSDALLLLLPLIVGLDVLLVRIVELHLLVLQELLSVCLPLSFSFFSGCLFLSVSLLDGFSADDVVFTRRNRHLQPFEQFAKALMVCIDFFLDVLSHNLFGVVDPHIGLILFLLLSPKRVGLHPLRQFSFNELLGFLPAELVWVGLADLVPLKLAKEEKSLQDVRHL